MAKIINTTFKLKNGLATNWTSKNPVLAAGEPGFEINTGKLKIGNGTDAYNDLPYIGGNAGTGSSGGADWNAAEGEPGYIANKPFESGEKFAEDIEFDPLNIPENAVIVPLEEINNEEDIEAYGDDYDIYERQRGYIKVSNLCPCDEDLINSYITRICVRNSYIDETADCQIISVQNTNSCIKIMEDHLNYMGRERNLIPLIYIIKNSDVTDVINDLFTCHFNETGIYFFYDKEKYGYDLEDITEDMDCISKLSFVEKNIKKIDEKFLPFKKETPDWESQYGEPGYIENKPFGEYVVCPRVELEFPPDMNNTPDFIIDTQKLNLENYENIPEQILFFKQSEFTPNIWDMIENSCWEIRCNNDTIFWGDFSEDQILYYEYNWAVGQNNLPLIIVVRDDKDFDYCGLSNIAEGFYIGTYTGTYVDQEGKSHEGQIYTSYIRRVSRIEKINEEYLPESVQNLLNQSDSSNSSALEFGGSWVIDQEYNSQYIPSGSGIKNYIKDQEFVTAAELYNRGKLNNVDGNQACAEGYSTSAFGEYSHAEGHYTTAYGGYSHAEGQGNSSQMFNPYKKDEITLKNKEEVIEEWNTTKYALAYGANSHIEGSKCLATGNYSHAEGNTTLAAEAGSHSEGANTKTANVGAHAEGSKTNAAGMCSHAEGLSTQTIGNYSHAEGAYTITNSIQHVDGIYNASIAGAKSPTTVQEGEALYLIGNGTSDTDRKNAFTVYRDGSIYVAGQTHTNGADYAEYLEWEDENPNDEDRRGLFVTVNEDKIRLAEENDFIIGIVSSVASIVGNSHKEYWKDRYLTDIFGSPIVERVEIPETEEIVDTYIDIEYQKELVINEETGEEKEILKPVEIEKEIKVTIPAHTDCHLVVNPDYDPDQKYLGRDQRKEWAAVGMLGMIVVVDDGTCVPNGFCKCGGNGVATAAETGYRVLKRLDENHIKIFFK